MRSVPQNLALALVLSACAARPAATRQAAAPVVAAAPAEAAPAPAAFRDRVRPVLQRRCTPCHEPGGVMYGRLPFDQPETIRGHREGVLRRLKGDEQAAVAAWLDAPS
jgi:hypothetical protein